MTFSRRSSNRSRPLRSRTLTATFAVLLPAAIAASGMAPATAAPGGLYGSVEGSASKAAATGSGKSVVGSLPNYDPDGFYSSLPLSLIHI